MVVVADDPRFQEPELFPCAAEGCNKRAAGWVGPELVPQGVVLRSEGPCVYLCSEHAPTWWERSAQPIEH